MDYFAMLAPHELVLGLHNAFNSKGYNFRKFFKGFINRPFSGPVVHLDNVENQWSTKPTMMPQPK